MKRSSDEIRYQILEILEKKGKINLEYVRSRIKTGLPTMLNNLRVMDNWGWVRTSKIRAGNRTYTELRITPEGREFIGKYRKLFKRRWSYGK